MPPKTKGKTNEVTEVDESHIRPGPRMQWTEVLSTNAAPGRAYHHATFWEGKLLLIGGWGGGQEGHVSGISAYDFSTNGWSKLNTEGAPHVGSSQSAMVDNDGVLIFFGGWSGKTRVNDVTQLNLETMTWSPMPTLGDKPPGLTFHSASYANKRCYLFGGNTLEGQASEMHFLDLGTKQWAHAASLGAPSKRSSHSASIVNDTIIVIFGGRGGADGSQALNDVALFDTTNNHWMIGVKVEGAPAPRYGHTAIGLRNKVIVFGGVGDQGQLLSDAWVLDIEKPNQLVWSRIQQDGHAPSARTGHVALEAMGSMYIVGGRTDAIGKTTSDVYAMDLGPVAPLPSTAGTLASEGPPESEATTSMM